jgi:hypothetical protein
LQAARPELSYRLRCGVGAAGPSMLRPLARVSPASRVDVGLRCAPRHRGGAGPCLSARLQGRFCVTPPVAAAESHRASLSFPSSKGKTGPIAVSSTSRHTCSSSCPLAGDQGCYAEAGFHTRLHRDRLSCGESCSPALVPFSQARRSAGLRQAAPAELHTSDSCSQRIRPDVCRAIRSC